MNLALSLSIIGSLFIAAGFFTVGRAARYKSTALATVGAVFALARNIVDHDQFWTGVAATGVVLLAAATASYYREARRAAGGAR